MVVCKPTVAGHHIEYYLASLKIETKFELSEACRAHHFPQARLILFSVEHEEASPSGSRDFPSYSPVALCELVPRIDVGIRNSVREAFL